MDRTIASADPDVLVHSVRIAAVPETVFPFFTDPERLVRWMGKTATLDPRPGGAFRVDYGKGDVAAGTYREVDPPRRLVLTWGWEAAGDPVPPGASTVEIDLAPDGDGTLLTLRHSGLPVESRAGHAEGWDHFLERLAEAPAA